MIKKIKNIFIYLNVVCLLGWVKFALAVNTDPRDRLDNSASQVGYNVYNKPTVQSVIIVIINYALGFVAIILVGLILYSGFQWMTSAGNEEKISKAKKTLQNATIGLLIIVSAWSITWFIADVLIKATTPGYYSFP